MRKKILLATIAFLFGTLLAWAGGTPSLPLNYQARIINGKFYVVRMLASPDPAPQGTFINSRGLRVDGAGTLYAISPAMAASPTIINSILGVAVDANGYLIVSVSGGSSMTWPSGGAGIPNYNGSSAWGTSYSASNPIPFNFLDTTVAKTDLSNLANPTAINLTTLTFAGAAGLTAGAEPVTITGKSVLFDNPSNTPDAQLGVALTSGEGGGVYIGLVPDPNDLGNTESKFTLESDDQADNLLQLGDGISNLNWIGTNYLTLDDGAGNQTIGYNTAQAGVANSPYSRWCGTFKATSGPTYGLDCWNVSNVIGAGVNGTSALTFAHSGSSGALSLPFPAGTTTNISTTGNAATATAVNFSGVASSTNTTAAMVVGSGASLAPTGTGTILASNVTPALSATGPVTLNQNFTAPALISNGVGPWISLTERANAITPAAGVDVCDQDSTAHGILCSQNGGVAQGLVTGGSCQASQSCAAPRAEPLHIWAGSFTFSSTSQAVTGLGTLCPTAILSVWASSQSHAYAYQISSISTAGFTITTTSNTDVWNWGVACY